MNKIQRYINWGKDKFFILLFAFMALYPASPLLLEYVSRDSGVFLFAGWNSLKPKFTKKCEVQNIPVHILKRIAEEIQNE